MEAWMKFWTLGAILLVMVLCWGCEYVASREDVFDALPPAEYFYEGKIILGSPSLTAGIPGKGPLVEEQIRNWLEDPEVHRELDFTLPLGLRDAIDRVWIPPDNPLTRAKIELGRQLFLDKRLSGIGTFACVTCHLPEQDYSAYMVMPEVGRNPPVCFNRILSERQFWDGHANALEDQIKGPISNPFEMNNTPEQCVASLKAIEGYQQQFDVIFGRLDMETIGFALASFQRALVTGPSPWDYHRLLKGRLLKNDASSNPDSLSQEEQQKCEQLRAGAKAHPMSDSAIRGESFFFGSRARCSWCHTGANLTDELYHNVGVGMDGEYPDVGRYKLTKNDAEYGAFKTPTLRNVDNTPPYMHNGGFSTLRKVVDWFDSGGFFHKQLDPALKPLDMSLEEKRDLVAFLESLSGPLPPIERKRLPQ